MRTQGLCFCGSGAFACDCHLVEEGQDNYIPDADRFQDDGSYTDEYLSLRLQEIEDDKANSRPCNCGSGEPWASCSVNSSYCG